MILFWKFKNGLFSKIGRKEKLASVSSNFERIKYWRRELFDNNLFFLHFSCFMYSIFVGSISIAVQSGLF